jgi:L-aminopeptidase/D-esterase-like protein
MRPGRRNLITDVAGLLVGQAEDPALKSGVTVVTAETPFVAAVDVMGGAPGTRETDLLAPQRSVDRVDAIVLAGGSAFGLEAASAVMNDLATAGRGYRIGAVAVPIVPAAIIFDLRNGGDKAWSANPYSRLGSVALAAASETVTLGSHGAGTGAMTATLMGGTGSASLVLDAGPTVGALAIVNAFGSAVVPGGREFWAAPFEIGGEFGGLGPAPRRFDPALPLPRKPAPPDERAHTTIAVVATDAPLSKAGAARMAEAAQDGIARSLVPAHTQQDGDLVFAVATGRQAFDGSEAEAGLMLGHAAAICLGRAVARAVFAARPAAGNLLPCWCQLAG